MTHILVGNAPCSWGSLEFNGLEGDAIGYAQMLDELVETGYTGTELGDWGYMPTDPDALREELSTRNLTMLGAFVPVALKEPKAHEPGKAEAVKTAQLLASVAKPSYKPLLVLADDNGSDWVRTDYAGRVTPDMELSQGDWSVFVRGVETIAQAVKAETGLRTVFHHHCAGCVETPNEIAGLMRRTDPTLVGLVFDTGHFAFGSGSNRRRTVMEGLDRLADRIWYVHFKDCDPVVARRARTKEWNYFESVRQGVFCELGKGMIDFGAVVKWLQEHEYRGYVVVEQDVLPGMGTPRESAKRNREYLKGLGI
jgi:inosose dehydratase